jgi:cytochrome c oxidase assembly factor CtaG
LNPAAPLTWSSFFTTWRLEPGWLLVCVLFAGSYVTAWRATQPSARAPGWRLGAFLLGCLLLWVTVASAVGTYAMSVFWMHMVLHLTLIMVVPAALVLGHPLTVLVNVRRGAGPCRRLRVARSRPTGLLTHPLTGLVVYSATIIGTHLTRIMDQMPRHAWLMTGEQVLYVVAGSMFLLPLLGEEPVRYRPPYLLRLAVLVAAMVPDTIVGIVLLQSNVDPFPDMMARHPAWAPPALNDIQIGGGLMWAAGDGLMMCIAVGLMISVLVSREKQQHLLGSWLERARQSAVTSSPGLSESGDKLSVVPEVDSEDSRQAYNQMLAQLADRER